MNCEKSINLLHALVENELDEPTAERVISHLIYCQSCETRFESLLDGKEMYANLFSEIQPPDDLPIKFQTKLETEIRKSTLTVKSPFEFYKQLSRSLACLRVEPFFVATSILIVCLLGFVLFSFIGSSGVAEQAQSTSVILEKSQVNSQTTETEPKEVTSATFSGEPKKVEIANRKKTIKKESLGVIWGNRPIVKSVNPRPETMAKIIKSNEDKVSGIAQIQEVEIDAARQIEKVEILFRAFRNAPLIEGTSQYDIAYEKQQARKLLLNNVALKPRVERYGSLSTGEMLNKVEPYLLDIANLDGNQSAEQVSKIKDRFRNQNIITSLQGF